MLISGFQKEKLALAFANIMVDGFPGYIDSACEPIMSDSVKLSIEHQLTCFLAIVPLGIRMSRTGDNHRHSSDADDQRSDPQSQRFICQEGHTALRKYIAACTAQQYALITGDTAQVCTRV